MEGTAVFGWYPVPFIYTIRARSSTEQSTALGGEGGGPSERGFVQRCGPPPAAAAAMLRDGNGSDRNHAMRCGRRTAGPAGAGAGEGPWTSEPMHEEADRHNINAPPPRLPPSAPTLFHREQRETPIMRLILCGPLAPAALPHTLRMKIKEVKQNIPERPLP